MNVAPATWKAPIVDATIPATHVQAKRIITIPVICRLHVVNGSLAQLVERPKHPYDGWIADNIRSVSRGFESRRNHEKKTIDGRVFDTKELTTYTVNHHLIPMAADTKSHFTYHF